jgi:hypothetical protein
MNRGFCFGASHFQSMPFKLSEKCKNIIDIIEFADTKRPMEKCIPQAAERRKRIDIISYLDKHDFQFGRILDL